MYKQLIKENHLRIEKVFSTNICFAHLMVVGMMVVGMLLHLVVLVASEYIQYDKIKLMCTVL